MPRTRIEFAINYWDRENKKTRTRQRYERTYMTRESAQAEIDAFFCAWESARLVPVRVKIPKHRAQHTGEIMRECLSCGALYHHMTIQQPDLLDACKRALVEINHACNKDEAINQSGPVGDAIRILQAAVTKAEGKRR